MEEENSTASNMITLKSRDGDLVVVPEAAAMLSATIRQMIEVDCVDGVIPLPNVDTVQILEKVMDYCKKHAVAEDEAAAEAAGEEDRKKSQEALRDWDKEFMDVDLNTLHDLFMAASYLVIEGLLDLAAEKCASIIKGKSVEEIRETFNLNNDFTDKEEEAIRNEHPFAFVPRDMY